MAKTKTRPWDAAEHLETEEDMAIYLEAALEDGDPALGAASLGDIARAKGMSEIARETVSGARAFIRRCLPRAIRNSPRCLRSSGRLVSACTLLPNTHRLYAPIRMELFSLAPGHGIEPSCGENGHLRLSQGHPLNPSPPPGVSGS
jgi:probable addiction module antidote protein